jgi:hypothetical protein
MWAQLLGALLGVWLMAAPAVLGYGAPAATVDRIAGPLAAMLGVVAASEVTRGVRRANLLVGLWLLAAPWLLGYPAAATLNSILVGLLLAALSFVRGTVKERFGGGWTSLWRSDAGG